eukprot:3189877-Prymnesium_polylepis.1
MKAISEADRHLLLGSMEHVPEHLVEEVARSAIIHPWAVALVPRLPGGNKPTRGVGTVCIAVAVGRAPCTQARLVHGEVRHSRWVLSRAGQWRQQETAGRQTPGHWPAH